MFKVQKRYWKHKFKSLKHKGRKQYYQNVQYVVVKNQDLLSVRTPLCILPILEDVLFWMRIHLKYMLNWIKNEVVHKFLLAGDKFMPEMYLKQPGFTYSACGPLNKSKERIRKFKETLDKSYIY